MSKKANPAIIGAFVITATVLAVAAVVVFGSGSFFKQKADFVLYFEDSVNGLAPGAPVKFKGVPIGQVKDILIRFNQAEESTAVPVIIEIDLSRLRTTLGVDVDLQDHEILRAQINDGLRATLQQASFVTGLLFVELNYVPGAPEPHFHQTPADGADQLSYPEIPTLQSGLTEVIKKVSKMVNQIAQIDFASMGRKLNDMLDKLDKGVGQINFKEINDETVGALRAFRELAENQDLKDAFANLDKTLTDLQGLIGNLDSDMGKLVTDLQGTLSKARDTLDSIEGLADNANGMVAPDSPLRYELTNALSEFAGASRSLRVLADYLERNPDALLTGKQKE
ncbi:MAG: MlaD family protein [Verrucomicrobiota bacterium]